MTYEASWGVGVGGGGGVGRVDDEGGGGRVRGWGGWCVMPGGGCGWVRWAGWGECALNRRDLMWVGRGG